MEKYYLELNHGDERNAGSKAVNDCNEILRNMGFKPFIINLNITSNKFLKPFIKVKELLKLKYLPNNALIVIPHPIYTKKIYIDFLAQTKKRKNIKYIFLIHDIESLRQIFPELTDKFQYIDKKMFEISNYIIAHNDKMKQYLINQGIKETKIYTLEVFDYLIPQDKQKTNVYNRSVVIAGNLDTQKSSYIEKLAKICSFDLHLYGVNFNESLLINNHIKYHGSYPADEIPFVLNEGFGLVWDGQSLDKCDGNTGNYLKYNNPHKLSLYIASGIPVIIWSKAAEAIFVKKYNIGFTVDSLCDIYSILENIDEKTYQSYLQNIRIIRGNIIKGYYLTNVMQKVLREIEKG